MKYTYKHKCLNCKDDFSSKSRESKFCNSKCCVEWKWQQTKKKIERGEKVEVRTLKKYLIEELGDKCQNLNCGWDWSNPCKVELEHKDGNSENNSLKNLTLLCPNCHSNTNTYKGKNKGNGRYLRRKRYKKGSSY